jgi:hypothetical protein
MSTSVGDPHHVDANPEPAYRFDANPDPACHFDADPDPACHFDADADPDPTFHFDANPDTQGSKKYSSLISMRLLQKCEFASKSFTKRQKNARYSCRQNKKTSQHKEN